MTISTAASRCRGLFTLEGAPEALNEMGALPQGCYGVQAPVPALALDFTVGELDPRITFSRASGGTRVNSAGLIETLTTNQPRFDYDPVTLAPRGLLIEEARANLLTYSSDFTNGAWSSAGTNTSVTANATTAPDGTVTASKLVAAATTGQHYMSRTATITGLVTSTAYTTSIYAKAAERSWLALYCGSMPASGVVYYDLASGALGAQNNGATGTIQAVGGGWYRCTYTGTTNGAVTSLEVHTVTTNNSFNSTGNGVDGIYIWGASFETGAAAAAAPFPTSYIPTTTAAVTRAADVASMTGTNFSSWFNATEGTFVAGFDTSVKSAPASSIPILSGGSSARFAYIGSMRTDSGSYDGGNIIYNAAVTVANGGAHKIASAYTAGVSRGLVVDGNAGYTGTQSCLAAYTSVSQLNIGYDASISPLTINGHLQRISFYPRRLPDATLRGLSA